MLSLCSCLPSVLALQPLLFLQSLPFSGLVVAVVQTGLSEPCVAYFVRKRVGMFGFYYLKGHLLRQASLDDAAASFEGHRCVG
ncbi:hypothetical protein BDY19DRAFT_421781 [Irpex rosettiformis]|uniref:Uncharacterized protein n=1 Tax=Irpex rosettiformis TaxID=378272 RepID=A0ACB8UGD9_9APHY|nr:hypothetical protein BDY19DRAFT_421781 [Irpex rosettiformis]